MRGKKGATDENESFGSTYGRVREKKRNQTEESQKCRETVRNNGRGGVFFLVEKGCVLGGQNVPAEDRKNVFQRRWVKD